MKLNKHAWIIFAVALAVVLVLAFVIPFKMNAVFWIALLCTAAMFGVGVWAYIRAFRKDDKLESKLLGWPIFKVAYTAVIVQIVVGFILMSLAAILPTAVAVLAEVIVFALTAFSLTAKDAVREAVTNSEAKVTDQTAGWKAIRARANALAAQSDNPDFRTLAEAIRYADPMPTAMDGEIALMLETLADSADAENIRKALNLVQERNSLAKASKNR